MTAPPTGTQSPKRDDLGFDPDVLRERYRAERDKRLRTEGIGQYRALTANFAHYAEDPYASPVTREPLTDEVDVVIIGAGIGGLLAGARLREAGLQRIRIVDTAGDFGGTWYWNRYPGAQCDIESYIYFPLLEETGFVPSEKYAHGPEILEYLQSVGRKYSLYDDACFQTEVTELRWDEADWRWVVKTNRNDEMRARFVVSSSGPLSRPKLPGIPGIDEYEGHAFHTSRWDYAYTGMDLTGLADKRVGVIGTGATAVQCIPALAEGAEHLYVFQRTPSSISVRGNRPTEPDWAKQLQPGWHAERMTNFNVLVTGGQQDVDLVGDGWTDIFRKVAGFFAGMAGEGQSDEELVAQVEIADFAKMEEIRRRVDSIVEDPATADALKPYYKMMCKRPCFSDVYLPTFNRPNVTLVDTDGRGVERFTKTGVVVDAKEYELDCVVFATGFEVGTGFTKRARYDAVGRNGIRLSSKWANGCSTFHGFYTEGFPNMFFLGITQTGLTINFPHMLDQQTRHIAHVLRQCRDRAATYVEASIEAEEDWCATMRRLAVANEGYLLECTPGYVNQEGRPSSANSLLSSQYGEGPEPFFALLRAWRDEGSMKGLELRCGPC